FGERLGQWWDAGMDWLRGRDGAEQPQHHAADSAVHTGIGLPPDMSSWTEAERAEVAEIRRQVLLWNQWRNHIDLPDHEPLSFVPSSAYELSAQLVDGHHNPYSTEHGANERWSATVHHLGERAQQQQQA